MDDVELGMRLCRELLPADRALLVTTRDPAVARALCAHAERLEGLTEAEASDVLRPMVGPLDYFFEVGAKLDQAVEQLRLAVAIDEKIGSPDLSSDREELSRLRDLMARGVGS